MVALRKPRPTENFVRVEEPNGRVIGGPQNGAHANEGAPSEVNLWRVRFLCISYVKSFTD